MAQDDASIISGWNVAPNVAYVLRLLPGAVSCGVFLFADNGTTMIASGAALAGTEQPCVLIPQAGQTVGMVDADLGWHLLLTTTGTESQRTIRLGPAADLPDEIHPVYGDDALAMVRATAAIDAAAHYLDDVTVSCPLGLGAGLGDVVSVPVDGTAVVGQVESITWTATPDGTTEQAVIRRHVAIAPEPFVEIVPPTVADDTGTATHNAAASGNVLTNDGTGLVVVAVGGLSANVGEAIAGDNGGLFTIESDGAWTFDPNDDFNLLEGDETADTSVTYHASNGSSEAMATLTVTVSVANTAPVAVDDAGATHAEATTSGNVLTNDTDADDDELVVSKVAGSAGNVGNPVAGSNGGLFTIGSDGAWSFDPDGDFSDLTGEQTATTSVTYHVSDGEDDDEGTLTVTVSAASSTAWTPAEITTALWLDAADSGTITLTSGKVSQWADKSGNARHVSQSSDAARPVITAAGQNGMDVVTFDGNDTLATAANFPETGNAEFSVFWVHTKTTSTKGCVFGWGNHNTALQCIGWYDDGTYAGPSFSGGAAYNAVSPAAGFNVWAYTKAAGAINATSVLTKNGSSAGTSGHSTSTPNIASAPLVLGRWATYTLSLLIGSVAEFIILPSAAAEADRQKVEGYLAHKWGLDASLPTDHPYKSAAPTV